MKKKSPPVQLPTSVFLDTNFLMDLVDTKCQRYQSAQHYFGYFLNNNVDVITSTICIAEFSVRQDPGKLLQHIAIYPFDYQSARRAGSLEALYREHLGKPKSSEKLCFAADIKILGQAEEEKVDYLVSADKDMEKLLTTLSRKHPFNLKVLNHGLETVNSTFGMLPFEDD